MRALAFEDEDPEGTGLEGMGASASGDEASEADWSGEETG
jgi:hypothetical protein